VSDRLPVGRRLTLGFALVMTLVLALTGIVVHARLGSDLQRQLDRSLHARADELSALITDEGARLSSGTGPDRLVELDERYAQVLSPTGEILDGADGIEVPAALTGAQIRRALRGPITADRGALGRFDDRVRLHARPLRFRGRTAVLVVASSREDRDEALWSLRRLLLLGGLSVLIVATLLASRVIAAALARLQRGIAREREFVASASHELRTPLTVIKAELELAQHPGRSAADLRAAITSSADEADRLARLIDDLLVLARADEGALALRSAPVPAADLLATVAGRFARGAGVLGRELAVVAGDEVIDGDRLLLEHAIGNLVDNALRHGTGRIELSARRVDARIRLAVRDQGEGIPDELRERAFERFSRGDRARGRGDPGSSAGAGLGLAIADAIARAHGGSASLGAAGRGEVLLELPLPARLSPSPHL